MELKIILNHFGAFVDGGRNLNQKRDPVNTSKSNPYQYVATVT